MRALTIGERAEWYGLRTALSVESLELVKWAALLFMLVEHWQRYVLDELGVFGFIVGRLVFPMFTLALVSGFASNPNADSSRLLLRLVAFGLLAQLAALTVRDALPLNVLFTFALGLVAYRAVRKGGDAFELGIAAGCVLLGSLCEFGPLGVLFVLCAFLWAEEGRAELWRTGALLSSAVGIGVVQGTQLPLLGVALAVALSYVDFRVPRMRGLFYVAYAVQFPLFFVAKELLT